MPILDKSIIKTSPIADNKAIVKGKNYRITVLTSRLFRLEYSQNGKFEDRATRLAVCRDFPVPEFEFKRTEKGIEIITEYLHLYYDEKPFSYDGLTVELVNKISSNAWGGRGNRWHYSEEYRTLDGTAETLDCYNGDVYVEDFTPSGPKKHQYLGQSLMNPMTGVSILDDSNTIAINEDGWAVPKKADGSLDLYFFEYWKDYKQCLKDFYRLTGATPMLPRYALGNWWSRNYTYSEKSYCALVNRFKAENVPFSVGVIDMDWHLIHDVPPEYGTGVAAFWTGYTWNRKLFPNPARFLKFLHTNGLKTTVNIHPADGIRGFEDGYERIADEMGVNKQKKETVKFDISSKKFLDAYFRCILNPLEDEGIDFWWVDWQQGGHDVSGYDTLWMLNHYHFIDSARRGEKPIGFSRYAGIGSHRYPVGFSGDTIVTWESLKYQPYFTASATNVGFGWWSHDIGGHMGGYRDGDLTSRWVQLGVFSPINRLHATNNEFNSKEPWAYDKQTELSMEKFLRLRHALVPYTYTMNARANKEGLPIVLPLYYEYPENLELYRCYCEDDINLGHSPFENQYFFGSELMVSPIVTKTNKQLNLAKVFTYLPDGTFIDFFTGRIYKGGKRIYIHRSFDEMPVFAKAGAIVPMNKDIKNSTENPKNMEIRIFGGENGCFNMYEDNDKVESLVKSANTEFKFTVGAVSTFTINTSGEKSVIPANRNFTLNFYALKKPKWVKVNGKAQKFTFNKDENKTTVEILNCKFGKTVTVELNSGRELPKNNIETALFNLVFNAQIEFSVKDTVFNAGMAVANGNESEMLTLNSVKNSTNELLIDAVTELIFADK